MPKLEIELTPRAMAGLHKLHDSQLFGVGINEIAERLICDRLVELAEDGWLPMHEELKLREYPKAEAQF